MAQEQLELPFAKSPPERVPGVRAFATWHAGRWHAVHSIPGGILASLGDAITQRGAQAMAEEWNRKNEQAA